MLFYNQQRSFPQRTLYSPIYLEYIVYSPLDYVYRISYEVSQNRHTIQFFDHILLQNFHFFLCIFIIHFLYTNFFNVKNNLACLLSYYLNIITDIIKIKFSKNRKIMQKFMLFFLLATPLLYIKLVFLLL